MSAPRYSEYKDSGLEWLGEVPKHWRVLPIKAIATCNDEVLVESTPDDYEIEYVEISGVDTYKGILEANVIRFGDAPSRARRRVRDGDVLVSTVRTYLRAITPITSPPCNMVVSTGFAVIRPRSVESGFLGYIYRAEFVIADIIARSVGVSYPAINASELTRLKVPAPPISEQQAISTFLDRETAKIDALVEEQEKLIALLKEKRQAVISHTVTKGIDSSVPMKDSGIEWLGEVPEHWNVWKMSHAVEQIGSGTTPNSGNTMYYEQGEIAWLNTGDLNDGELLDCEKRVTERAVLDHSSLKLYPSGSIVIAMYGATIGKLAILGFPATVNQACCVFAGMSQFVPKFLFYSLLSLRERIISMAVGGGQPNINQDILRNLRIACPDSEEQLEICAFLDQESKKIEALVVESQHTMDLLKERRSALISAAVMGKIDVRGLVGEEVSV